MSDRYRLGLVTPAGGTSAMYTPALIATAELAVHEFNQRGGVLGREIELISIRIGPNALHDLPELRLAIDRASLHGLICCHDSHVRELVIDLVDGRFPIFYPPIWEGGQERAGVICTGDNTEVKVWPVIDWLAKNAAATDWMIVGTDYLWPRGTARMVEPLLSRRGWWHGTHLVPYSLMDDLDDDDRVVRQLVDAVEASSASCVLALLHGSQMAMFNREFAARGLDERVLRFAPMADEAVLLASGPETTRGLITAFGSLDGEHAEGEPTFLDRYAALHGRDFPEPTGITLAGYEGVAVASAIVTQAGTLSPTMVDLARVRAEGFEFDAPTGRVSVGGATLRRPMTLMMADGVELSPFVRLD